MTNLHQAATRSARIFLLLSALVALLVSGCKKPQVIGEYGRRVGREGPSSVNGTAVLSRMFREGGARVRTSTRLGRFVDDADAVVWIPDRYASPSKASRDYLEDWLATGSGKTLIYVGRDYDASVAYWQYLVENTPDDKPDQFIEARRKLAEARVAETTQRSVYDPKDDCDWFALDRSKPSRRINSLKDSLSDGVDASRVDIELHTRILQSKIVTNKDAGYRGTPKFESLLSSNGDVLVGKFTRQNWRNNQIIVVANGSWLLNLPLVNHDHRRLAGNLINECGNVDRVVFLESGPSEPPVSSHEPNQHHGLAAFTVWPMNCILMHLLALGIVFCFTVFPIFGRPRRLHEADTTDFGKHVYAIGEIMEQTGDRQYAMKCREQYFQRVSDTPKTTEADVPSAAPTETATTPTTPAST